MDSIEITLKCRRYQQHEIVQIINVFIDEWNTKQGIPMNIVEKIGLVYCKYRITVHARSQEEKNLLKEKFMLLKDRYK